MNTPIYLDYAATTPVDPEAGTGSDTRSLVLQSNVAKAPENSIHSDITIKENVTD
ncbi:MAG: hypothetical protein KAT04_03145 [Methylococcales bacterium]|nr:hypothetical protein [Methylococcales bacterium]